MAVLPEDRQASAAARVSVVVAGVMPLAAIPPEDSASSTPAGIPAHGRMAEDSTSRALVDMKDGAHIPSPGAITVATLHRVTTAAIPTAEAFILATALPMGTDMIRATPTFLAIPTTLHILTRQLPWRRPATLDLTISTATGYRTRIATPISSRIRLHSRITLHNSTRNNSLTNRSMRSRSRATIHTASRTIDNRLRICGAWCDNTLIARKRSCEEISGSVS